MLDSNAITIHGPYEDALIAGFELLGKIIDGQDAATKKELWTRYLEFTAPLHSLSTDVANAIATAVKDALKP